MLHHVFIKLTCSTNTPINQNLSRLTTVLFLPALYFAEVGPQADLPTLLQCRCVMLPFVYSLLAYLFSFQDWPIILVSLLSISVSYIYAVIGYRYFNDEYAFPKWIIPSCMFNVHPSFHDVFSQKMTELPIGFYHTSFTAS